MIQINSLSNDQRNLSKSVLRERSYYPVTFNINEVVNFTNFPGTDASSYLIKTATYTPPWDVGIGAITFVAANTNSSVNALVGVQVSLSSAIFTAGLGAAVQGPATAIMNVTTAPYGRNFSPSKIEHRDFHPYVYYITAGTPIYIYWRAISAIGTMVAKLTFHMKVTTKG